MAGNKYLSIATKGGHVLTFDDDGNLEVDGGPVGGGTVIRAFPFTFATPNLATGATMYVPTIGDILYDAWIEIDTAWNGTTPLGDMGDFTSNTGWFQVLNGAALDMTTPDTEGLGTGFLTSGLESGLMQSNIYHSATRLVPAKVDAATQIKVVVSNDGTSTGADPGATQGAAILYVMTGTPVTA